jgi:hypothetical protein
MCLLHKDHENIQITTTNHFEHNSTHLLAGGQWVYEVIVKSIEVDAQFKLQICWQYCGKMLYQGIHLGMDLVWVRAQIQPNNIMTWYSYNIVAIKPHLLQIDPCLTLELGWVLFTLTKAICIYTTMPFFQDS